MKRYFLPILLASFVLGSGVFAQTIDGNTTTTMAIPTTTSTTMVRPLTLNVPKEDLKQSLNIVDNENLQISIKAGMVLSIEEENITVVVFNQTYKADISSARITNAKWINLDKELIRPGDIVNIFGSLNSDFTTITVKTLRDISLRDIRKNREILENTTTTLTSIQLNGEEFNIEDIEGEQKKTTAIQSLIEKLQNLLK